MISTFSFNWYWFFNDCSVVRFRFCWNRPSGSPIFFFKQNLPAHWYLIRVIFKPANYDWYFVEYIFKCIFREIVIIGNIMPPSLVVSVHIFAGNGMAPTRLQTISWTHGDPVHVRIGVTRHPWINAPRTRTLDCSWELNFLTHILAKITAEKIRVPNTEVNTLWHSGAKCRIGSGDSLLFWRRQLSYHLNQFRLVISKVQWHLSEDNFTRDTSVIYH